MTRGLFQFVHESLIGIRRAGPGMILAYFAKQWAEAQKCL